MAGTINKLRLNENEADKFTNVKKFGVTCAELTKRAALGDIQNRGILRNVPAKDAAQKDIKDTKLQNAIRNTKARVDTQWKKGALSTVAATKPTTTVSTVTAVGGRKLLTRSNSVRLGVTTTSGAALQRHAPRNLLIERKTKLTTEIVENKLQQVKLVNKTKTTQAEEKATIASANTATATTTTATTTLRREDSNLSRKSLTKLKAALPRDAAAVPKLIAKGNSALSITNKNCDEAIPKPKAATTESGIIQDKAIEKPAPYDIKIESVQTHSSKLLDDVEDIDAGDTGNLVLVSEYVNDIYNYLYNVEVQQGIKPNHLEGQAEVTPEMRAVLIDWINEVLSQFRLAPETFQLAVAIIDRYLQAVENTKRAHLQLVGVTALFIATKYEELLPLAIADIVYITDDTYTAKQIRQMELQILKALDYSLARPLPIHFLRRYSKAAHAEERHHAMSKYFLELASVEYELAAYKPSEIAAASLFLALHLLNDNARLPTGFNNKHWTATLEHYSRYTPEYLRPIAKKIGIVARNAQNAKLKAVFKKYESTKLNKTSLRPELYGALMDSIINSKDQCQITKDTCIVLS